MTLRGAVASVFALFRKSRLDGELDGEVIAHLELAERDLIASGLSAAEARRIARQRFGGVEQMKEEHRDRRSFRLVETLLRDLRYGFASFVRDPGFSAAVVAVLALGIGANVAMFTILDAVLLKPLPFPQPDQIVEIWEAPRPGVSNATSTLDFLDWRRLGTAFEAMSAELSISVALTGNGEPERLSGKAVTSDYFRVFGINAQLGRTFTEDDQRSGAAPTLVLSYAAWQSHFGGDPNILNRRPVIDGQAHQIIGVLPPGVFDRDRTQFWKALAFTPDQRTREIHWLTVYGRLREGFSLAQARERMGVIYQSLQRELPNFDRQATVEVEPLEKLLIGTGLRQSIYVAFGAVALVLLIACANVANLLLAKGVARQKEFTVRAALGASRGRLIAQLLTESLVLCILGGVVGGLLASFLLKMVSTALPQSLPFTADVTMDIRVVTFTMLVTLGVAVLAGMLPALQISSGNLSSSLNQSSRGSSGAHARIRRTIVIAEVALSLVLVCGSLLLFRTLLNLQRVETGVRIENVMTMTVNLPKQSYGTQERAALFYESVAQRLQAAPAVAQAALASQLPLEWIGNGEGMQIPGVEQMVRVRLKRVDPGYFSAFGIPLLTGRGISASDRNGAARIVVINEALAARLADVAGISSPVGRKVRLSVPPYHEKPMEWADVEIAGVIRNERVSSPGSTAPPVAYVPFAQVPYSQVKLIVRTQSDPAFVMPAIREAVHEVDPNLPLGDIATMQQVRDRTFAGTSRPAMLIGAFAFVAVMLTAIGLYGVLSHTVTQQRREIGIRMALGARAGDVISHVLKNALTMVIAGLVAGLLGAVAMTRVMKNLLFEVSPLDPVALIAACVAMATIGLLAGFLPAQRAARVDPVTTLREEG